MLQGRKQKKEKKQGDLLALDSTFDTLEISNKFVQSKLSKIMIKVLDKIAFSFCLTRSMMLSPQFCSITNITNLLLRNLSTSFMPSVSPPPAPPLCKPPTQAVSGKPLQSLRHPSGIRRD